MMLAPSMVGTRARSWCGMAMLLAGGLGLLSGCATQRERGNPAPGARTQALTVPQLRTMLDEGEAIGVIIGQIEGSGTVYRLTTEQREALRANGMPASLLGLMQSTYDHAIAKHPDLATSNDRWIKIGDYWYGGLPAGWPRDWVVGAP